MSCNNNLYLVARWGNENDGADGKDTLFLISARSEERAAAIADQVLSETLCEKVSAYSNWICLLGTDAASSCQEQILQGPFIGLSAIADHSEVWTREYEEDGWISRFDEIEQAQKNKAARQVDMN